MATDAELEALRQRFANILLGNVVQRIGFHIAGHDISPGGFAVIGMSLAASGPRAPGRTGMSVRVDDDLPPHAGAAYHAMRNTIQVPTVDYGQTHRQRLTLVHEAVHAIFDYQRIALNAMREEAAAYIADAMYSALLGFPPDPTRSRLELTARRIADGLLPGSPGTGGARPAVTDAQLTELCNHIHAHGAYNATPRRMRYLHNGGAI